MFYQKKIIIISNRNPDHSSKKSEDKPSNFNSSNTSEVACFGCGRLSHYKTNCSDLTKAERDELLAKRDKKLKERRAAMIAEEETKEDHFSYILSYEHEGYIDFEEGDDEV